METDRHLTADEIDLYADGNLRGAPMLAALIHLEHCDECRPKLPALDEDKFLNDLLGDE